MSSCPVIALILEGEGVIQGVRDLLGPTDSNAAPAGTIRGDLGTDRMKNVVHASDVRILQQSKFPVFSELKKYHPENFPRSESLRSNRLHG